MARKRQYRFLSPTGEIVTTNNITKLALANGLKPRKLQNLSCGYITRHKNWCSTHRKARAARQRFLTALVNTKTGETSILGQTVTAFSEAHDLCKNEVYKLIHKRKRIYKHWMLAQTHDNLGLSPIADSHF